MNDDDTGKAGATMEPKRDAGRARWAVPVALALALSWPFGAAATSSPVPPECQASGLSPAAQARCDFIARTPDICQRQGLSEDTQRWCDQLGATADESVPPECQHSNLSPAAQARCDFIARTPDICQRQGLSEDTQRWCDQKRFAGEPQFTEVRLARNGAVRSIHLIVTKTGQEVFTSYPYGVEFGRPHDDDRVVRMKSTELDGMLEGRPTPAGTTPAPSGYATGLPIGWNDTSVPPLGVTPGQCLNYTINTPSNYKEQTTFSSFKTADSTSAQTNVSATVSGGVGAFKASNTFSFSDQWQSSTNSTTQYYNAYALYTLPTSVPESDPLNAQGQNAGTSFNTLCGSEYMSAVTVGMVATLSLNYGSSSQATQTQITDAFSASEGLESLKTAVSTANSDSSSNSYFTFSMVHQGGGPDAAKDLHDAFAMTNSSGEAYYLLCADGNSSACGTFQSNMDAGTNKAVDDFNALVEGLGSASNPDISFFETFPSGVAGVASALATTAIPESTANEVLLPYLSDLKRYVTLLNEIGTLNNRVSQTLLKLLEAGPGYNAPQLLDLVSYLDRLENVYNADRTTLLENLESCLNATESNVTSVCAPIIDNQASNAFKFYADPPQSSLCVANNDCFFAEQNTIALQYVANSTATTPPASPSFGSADTFYIDKLPSFAAAGSNIPIAGQAGLVTFVDRPSEAAETAEQYLMGIVALQPGKPLSTENLSAAVDEGSGNFTLWVLTAFSGPNLAPIEHAFFTSTACTPTFTEPCTITYQSTEKTGQPQETTTVVANRQIEGFFTPN